MDQLEIKTNTEKPQLQDPLAIRKQLATMFETFLVQRMQQGQVDPEAAKTTAKDFVEIFQKATSIEAQQEAITTLAKNDNPLLHNFALKVQEMNEVQVKHDLYEFMLKLAQKGEISTARDFYQLFDRGEIHDNASLQAVIAARQNSLGLREAAQGLKLALEQNKQSAAAAQLDQLIQSGNIKTKADLDQWQSLIPGYIPQKAAALAPGKTMVFQGSPNPALNIKKMSQLRRLWEGVHRFDQQLRHLLGLDK